MGGIGSGRWLDNPKRVVEGLPAIDAADLRRWLVLRPGSRSGKLSWHRGGDKEPFASVTYSATVGKRSGVLVLSYRLVGTGESAHCPVRLVTTRCHFGGRRWWLRCPLSSEGTVCGRRVRKLYLVRGRWGCRRCHDLTYTSTQTSDSRVYAAARDVIGPGPHADGRGWTAARLALAYKVIELERRRADRRDKLKEKLWALECCAVQSTRSGSSGDAGGVLRFGCHLGRGAG